MAGTSSAGDTYCAMCVLEVNSALKSALGRLRAFGRLWRTLASLVGWTTPVALCMLCRH